MVKMVVSPVVKPLLVRGENYVAIIWDYEVFGENAIDQEQLFAKTKICLSLSQLFSETVFY